MTPENARRAEDLFASVLELEPGERREFLDRCCGSDTELRGEVESLLHCHSEAEAEGWEIPPTPPSEALPVLAHLRARTLAAESIGPFQLQDCLGEGATGVVYRALDTRTDQIVALKIALPRTLDDPAGAQRFQRAASASLALAHPNIARTIETGKAGDLLYVALEYVEGRTLAQELRLHRFDAAEALRLARQIAEVLQAAHELGIIHRDLKPANIMITSSGAIKVLDFGLCHASAGRETIARTGSGVALGTLGYMAPEQARGETPTPQSDLFSLGAVLYEMLSGQPAFRGDTPVAILSSVLQDVPARAPGVPRAAAELAMWCLEKDPRWRPVSARQIVAEIDRMQSGVASGPLAARSVGRLLRVATAELSRHRVLALSAALLGLGAIGAGVYRLRAPNQMPVATRITNEDGALDAEPAISPDRKWITFASNRGGEGQAGLWIVPASGGTPRQLTRNDINPRHPEFSPESRTIVYRSDRDGGGIFRIGPDQSPKEVPASIARGGLRPRYSPDGKWIVYWDGLDTSGDLFATGASRVFVIPAQGGEARQICPDFTAAAYPIWSPDGSSILFAGRRAATSALEDSVVWVTPFTGCQPIPIGTASDFVDFGGPSPIIPERWLSDDRLWFRGQQTMALQELSFSASSGRILRPAKRLPVPVGTHNPYVLDAKTIAFVESHDEASLWSLPLDAAGHEADEPVRILECGSVQCIPALSSGGEVLLYSRLTSDSKWEFVRRELPKARDEVLNRAGAFSPWPFVIDHSLDAVYSRSSKNSKGIEQFTAERVSATGGSRKVICHDCPELWDVSPSGRYLLSMSGGVAVRTIGLIDTVSGARTELLADPKWNLYRASFSADERSILFTGKLAPDKSQIFVARFQPECCVPPAEWVPITEATEYNGPAHWSPDANLIYFTSQRDGYRCLYVRAWDARSGAAAGPITIVRHFHAGPPSLGLVPQSLFGFAVSRDKVVFAAAEQRGQIWLVH
jgi:Tol biopolymer transport system component